MADEGSVVEKMSEEQEKELLKRIVPEVDMCEGCAGPRSISVAKAECMSCFRGSGPEVQEALGEIARLEKDIGDSLEEGKKLTIRVPHKKEEDDENCRYCEGLGCEACDARRVPQELPEEEIDYAKYVRPLRVPAENCQEEVVVLVRRHVVTSTGLYLPEHLACNDSNLTRHEVVRIPDGETHEELGFTVGDHVFIAVPSGFQKPQVSSPLDTDKNLLLVSNKFIIAVDERPKEEHVKPGDFYKED